MVGRQGLNGLIRRGVLSADAARLRWSPRTPPGLRTIVDQALFGTRSTGGVRNGGSRVQSVRGSPLRRARRAGARAPVDTPARRTASPLQARRVRSAT